MRLSSTPIESLLERKHEQQLDAARLQVVTCIPRAHVVEAVLIELGDSFQEPCHGWGSARVDPVW